MISETEEKELAFAWQNHKDQEALDKLITSNIGLVVSISQKYFGPSRDDLIQAGSLGLVEAARRYDPERGNRFSTYATYWIRAYMLSLIIDTYGPANLGTTKDKRKAFFGLSRARQKLEAEGDLADTSKLAEELDVDEAVVSEIVLRMRNNDLELDATFEDSVHDNSDLVETETPSPETYVIDQDETEFRKAALFDAIERLDEKERVVIQMRIFMDPPRTLEQVGEVLGCSDRRVKQLEEKAKKRLRYLVEGLE